MTNQESIGIAGSGCYFPKNKVSIMELAQKYNMPYEPLLAEHGVKQVHVSKDPENAIYMATEAVKSAMQDARLKADGISMMIYCDGMAQEREPRTCSLEILRALKSSTSYGFDLEGGFIGSLMGLQIAKDMLINGPGVSNAIIVASQRFDKTILYSGEKSRLSGMVFGDGAAAVVLSKSLLKNNVLASTFIIDHYTNFINDLIEKKQQGVGKSVRNALGLNKIYRQNINAQLIKRSVANSYKAIDLCLKSVNLDIRDIDHFVKTQLMVKETEQLAKKMNIDKGKMYNASEDKGNLGHADILSNLHITLKNRALRNMDIMALVSPNYDCSSGAIVLRR